MKRRAVGESKPPNYPSREEGADEAGRHVPQRWKANSTVVGALAYVMIPTSMCAPEVATEPPPPEVEDEEEDSISAEPVSSDPPLTGEVDPTSPSLEVTPEIPKQRQLPPAPRPFVWFSPAPLARVFERGEGRGAFGCVAIAPPAFLTESDARQVILEELVRAGIDAKPDGLDITLSASEHKPTEEELRARTYFRHMGDADDVGSEPRDENRLRLDGFEPERKIGFEFVGIHDYVRLGGEPSLSSVQLYDTKGLAKELAKRIEGAKAGWVGVFYDPLVPAKWDDDGVRGWSHEAGDQQLREQVRAFVKWLRTERVL
ncbi:MAG: hypothetical protein HY791_24700 [Deltaproteobacteria bacterium]|nr:hypothetical protein [Deltaproteobacteria bacterium]